MSLETQQTEQELTDQMSDTVEQKTDEIRKDSVFKTVKKSYVKYTTSLGAHIFHMFKHVGVQTSATAKKVCKVIGNGAARAFSFIKSYASKAGAFLTAPIIRLWNKGKQDFSEVKTTYNKKGFKPAFSVFFKGMGRFFCGSKGVFVTAFNYLAPVVSVVFLVALVDNALNTEYGLEVNLGDNSTYVVADESVYGDAEKIFKENAVTGDTQTYATFSIRRLSPTTETVEANEIADMMLSNEIVENNIVDAAGVYINGECVAVISEADVARVNRTLDELLAVYATGREGEKLSFVDDITIESGIYREETVESADELINLLTSKVSVETYYTIEAGDAPISIAQKNGLTLEELQAMNPEVLKTCFIGDKVILSKEQPYLSVQTTYTENYDEVIDYEIIETVDETMYIGASVLIQSGSEGLANRTAEVVLVNGYETTRNIIEETVITEAVPRKIKVGGKTYSGATLSMIEKAGKFMWPLAIVQGEYVSSSFGYRTYDWSYHYALDIAAPRGTPIYASADGYVSWSAYRGSYGNLVILDHQNGYETYYAHCHALYAKPGTYVKKGDLIAIVGTTGSSGGYHLHFEVRYNGVRYDPFDFMSSPVPVRG